MTPSFFWRAKVSSRSLSQPCVELALVLVGPLLRHVVRRVCGAGREVDEERLVGDQRLLLADPADGLVGHVLHEVVALFGRLLDLDRRRALVQRGIPLVRLAADEAVEVLEAAAAGRPGVEGPRRAGLPHRHLVALAELRRGIAIQLQRLRQRRRRCSAAPSNSPGAPLAISVMPPMPTEWWLRPVSSAWRVGEHSAVV